VLSNKDIARIQRLSGIIKESYEGEFDEDDYDDEDGGEQYFNTKLPDPDVKNYSKKWVGRGVTWFGDPEQMIVIDKDDVHGMWGNIYDNKKLKYVENLIDNSSENVEFECSYGIGGITTFTDIQEEQQSSFQDGFSTDYEHLDEPSSTGNEELDAYVGNENYSYDEFYTASDEAHEFFENYKFSIIKGKQNAESLHNMFSTIKKEEDEEYFSEFIKFESGLKEAQNNEDGDFNRFTVQLRDGHHRVMGAIAAGERYVCLNLDKDSIQEFKGRYKKV